MAARHSSHDWQVQQPPAQPAVIELTLEQAKEQALSSNSQLRLGQLNLQEKRIAIAAGT